MVDTKKTDISSNVSNAETESDFNLKHRVAGAACLLFFGALVLPWLLGPPSAASKAPTALIVDENESEISAVEIENEILAEFEDNTGIETEQVYISKITPLDAVRVEEEKRRAEAEKSSKSSAAVMAMANVGEPASVKKTSKVKVDKSEKKQVESNNTVKDKAAETVKDSIESSKPQKVVKSTTKTVENETKKSATKAEVDTREEDLITALAAETTASSDVGWVVQVGVFTDSNGAEKVVKDLKTKGFKPSTSVVDTNRGKGTGTRVWLGPFAQRVDAAKTKTRLTDRTGEPGFIRAYP